MITHVIKLKTDCTLTKLKLYLTRFFKHKINDSRYIFMLLSLKTINNNLIKIGENRVLDLKKNKDTKSYRHHIDLELEATDYFSPSNDDKVNKIIFNYTEISRKEYLNQRKFNKRKYT